MCCEITLDKMTVYSPPDLIIQSLGSAWRAVIDEGGRALYGDH